MNRKIDPSSNPSGKSDTTVSTMVSAMKARGAHDPDIQRIVIEHCRRGNTTLMEEATSEYLIAQGVASSLIPAPTAIIDLFLAERADAAIHESVEDYRNRGGALLARRFTPATRLVNRMQHIWKSMRPPRIAGTEDLPNYEKQHERIARASVAAQALQFFLRKRHLTTNGDASLIYHEEEEEFCMAAVRIMEFAYRAPDEWVQQRLNSPELLLKWVEDQVEGQIKEKEKSNV